MREFPNAGDWYEDARRILEGLRAVEPGQRRSAREREAARRGVSAGDVERWIDAATYVARADMRRRGAARMRASVGSIERLRQIAEHDRALAQKLAPAVMDGGIGEAELAVHEAEALEATGAKPGDAVGLDAASVALAALRGVGAAARMEPRDGVIDLVRGRNLLTDFGSRAMVDAERIDPGALRRGDGPGIHARAAFVSPAIPGARWESVPIETLIERLAMAASVYREVVFATTTEAEEVALARLVATAPTSLGRIRTMPARRSADPANDTLVIGPWARRPDGDGEGGR